ncbi:hypothetical protein [Mycobacterium sp.]|uniref:hypothetical protein n=1 Tax=Mycobacterium sp. TaxID=1785 RepID=UPI002F3EE965
MTSLNALRLAEIKRLAEGETAHSIPFVNLTIGPYSAFIIATTLITAARNPILMANPKPLATLNIIIDQFVSLFTEGTVMRMFLDESRTADPLLLPEAFEMPCPECKAQSWQAFTPENIDVPGYRCRNCSASFSGSRMTRMISRRLRDETAQQS